MTERLPKAISTLRKGSYAMLVSIGTLADAVENGTDIRSRSRTTLTAARSPITFMAP